MKLSTKTILPIFLITALLILLVGCLPGLLTPPTPKGVITGRVMVPSSETTKDIIGWIPVANATVTLTDSEGVTHTVTTDEDGYYTFTDIAVNANTIITATATVDGNTVIIKDVIPQAVAATEDYDAGAADAESTALGLIVEELLEQGLDPEDINLEEIQDSDNFTEVAEQVSTVLEENGNVTTDPDVTETVSNAAEEIINPPVYTPPEEPPEPEYTPPPVTPNKPPTTNAGPDRIVVTKTLNVILNGTGTDPDGTVVSYSWNFGDDKTEAGTVAEASHDYDDPGTYEVTLTVTDNAGATDSDTMTLKIFATIQGGIDAALIGDSVEVMAGIYTPLSTIIINKDNLTLIGPQADIDPRPSVGGRTGDEAVIDGDLNSLGMIICIDADNVIINGFEIKSGTEDMIKQDTVHSGTIVKYNIIHDGRGDEGVQLKKCTNGVLEYNYVFEIADKGDGLNIADNSSYGTIRYNEVCGIHGENAAIYIYDSEHMEIIGNLVRDSGVGGNDGIKVGAKDGSDAAAKQDVLVKDNIIHDITQDGISVYMSDVTVEGNEIYNCHSENGAIYLAWGISNITIKENTIYDNTLNTGKWGNPAGILIGTAVDAFTVTINNNNIYNNIPNGVTNKATANVEATDNWWGSTSGPYHETTNPYAQGNAVSGNVTYRPFSEVPY